MNNRVLSALLVTLLLGSAATLAALFNLGWVVPLHVGIVMLLGGCIIAVAAIRVTPLSIYPRLMLLAYGVPFSILVGYLFENNYVWMFTARGIQVSSDPVLIAQMVDVGLIGLLGLVAGLFVVPPVGDVVLRAVQTPKRTLDPIAFALALVGAVAFSWVASPSATIFDTATNSTSVADKLNFGAAYMVSYLIFALLFMDTERESQVGVRAAKGWVLAAAAAYVVIFLQLLRGDRESSGMLAAFAALYLTSPAGLKADTPAASVSRRRIVKLIPPGVAALVVFVGLGAIRYNASTLVRTLSPVQIVRLGSAQSTWTAVLWTNLSAAWQYRVGDLQYHYGETYVDYVLALPPGPITKAIGVSRPIEKGTSLASEDPAGVSSGGLHPVVTPFKNFGALGVAGILFLWGWLIANIERWSMLNGFGGRWIWAAAVCSGLMWFWYGDPPFIRALMIAGMLYIVYRIAIGLRIAAPRPIPAATHPMKR